jgi:hypothetical protein
MSAGSDDTGASARGIVADDIRIQVVTQATRPNVRSTLLYSNENLKHENIDSTFHKIRMN